MECPICGEVLALNDKECPACGAPADRLFLTEEVDTSRIRKRTFDLPDEEENVHSDNEGKAGLAKRLALRRKKNGSGKTPKKTDWR